ncbi:MAG: hypothetical protein IJU40_06145, partial [Desulfovibrionaceae bacterium]|nr:hypothetical protein [Desulfovibrionaceae bacterium]
VVNQKLTDMSGEQFCKIVRLHPLLLALPILLVLPTLNEGDQLLALECGASAILPRPYSVEDMQTALHRIKLSPKANKSLSQGEIKADVRDFDAALVSFRSALNATQHKPEDYFRVGMLCLNRQKWNSALQAFQQALASQVLKGEAQLGMAAAYRGKGQDQEAETWLSKAAETFVSAGNWHNARTVYAKAVNLNEKARNPFFTLARKQITQGEYDGAALTLSESVKTASPETLCDKMASLCAQAKEPQEMLNLLQEALKKSSTPAPLDFSHSLSAKVATKVKEQEERLREAKEKREAALSERMAKSWQPEVENSSPETSAEKLVSGDEKINSKKSHPPKAKIKGIAPREEAPKNALGLATLPGDANHHTNLALPTSPTSTSFFGDLFRVAKLTWRLSRDKKD